MMATTATTDETQSQKDFFIFNRFNILDLHKISGKPILQTIHNRFK